MTEKEKPTGLALLREPFPAHHISKLPKPTKKQTEEVKADFQKGIRCQVCGTWHHPKVVHLDYVGHAALTDRLLDCDSSWTWEPISIDDNGLPRLTSDGLFWIRLTVCGITRLGVGDAGDKKGGDAMKERIGDALRNAAMRFGAALDLWHKGDLHISDETDDEPPKTKNHNELLPYTDADLQKNLPKWHDVIKSGKKSVADIIATISSKYTLSAAQMAAITPPLTVDDVDEAALLADLQRGGGA